jgi:hypothetical protein
MLAVVATRTGLFTAVEVVNPFNLSVIVDGILFSATKKATPKDSLLWKQKRRPDLGRPLI